MAEESRPRIEYPCAYPIKVMGLNEADFVACIVAIVRRHDPGLQQEQVSFRASRNGKYLSVNVVITATGPDHIQTLFEDLKASGRVAVVL
jgi:hypothetical protein